MRTKLIRLILILVGAIHLYPGIGIFSAARLQQLYGIVIEDRNLLLLMRHRALLFGLFGALLILSAFQPSLRWFAYVAGIISTAGFLLLVGMAQDYNEVLRRVVIADWVAVSLLLLAILFDFVERRNLKA